MSRATMTSGNEDDMRRVCMVILEISHAGVSERVKTPKREQDNGIEDSRLESTVCSGNESEN